MTGKKQALFGAWSIMVLAILFFTPVSSPLPLLVSLKFTLSQSMQCLLKAQCHNVCSRLIQPHCILCHAPMTDDVILSSLVIMF